MNGLTRWIRRFLREEDGPTTVEYALLLLLILAAALSAVVTFGQATNACLEHSRNEFANVMP
ncbi:MAG: Flp family type IVb pilin [Pirellulales bacterium]|nr:Flp family type IVb pilin [Pirellulales bacterium]